MERKRLVQAKESKNLLILKATMKNHMFQKQDKELILFKK